MKKSLLFLFILIPMYSFSTVHMVEVGGSQTITPYYSPQFFSVEVGDTVIWDFVTGTHNITTTSGPVSISSGDLESPATYQHIFNVEGIYDYECTLWDHADTQFGTITVTASTVDINDSEIIDNQISLFPIPANNAINISSNSLEIVNSYIVNLEGKKISDNKTASYINVEQLTSGFYFIHIHTNKGIVRKRILVN